MEESKDNIPPLVRLGRVGTATIIDNKVIGTKRSFLEAEEIETLNFINNQITEQSPTSVEDVLDYLKENKEILEKLESAKQGDGSAKEFLKTILNSSTAEITKVGLKMLLKQYGVNLE